MSFSYQVTLSDPANVGGSADAILVYDLQQALNVWSQYISGLGTLVVALDIANTAEGREAGGPTSSSFVSTKNGINIFEASSQYELTTGQHVSGTNSDITITIDPGYFKNLDLAANLSYGSQVPSNEYNPIVVFLHELEHGFGMQGWYSQSGQLPGDYESLFDSFIQISPSGSAFFSGPDVEAVYGGPVLLTTSSTTQNYYHLGNTISDIGRTPGTVQDPLTLDLMNGVVLFFDYQYKISALDLAVLKDLGYNVTITPTISSLTATSDTSTTQVPTGHVVTINVGVDEVMTVLGAPTLQLNDNEDATYKSGSGTHTLTFTYTVKPGDHTSDLQVTGLNLPSGASIHDAFGTALSSVTGDLGLHINEISATTIQSDYLAITRTALSLSEATTIANSIIAGTQTETQYVNSLLSQVADTTTPAAAVEGSMYGAVGTSAEVTTLATQFLPPQVANALQHGFNPQVYASEALGLAFAFGNENGSTAFSTAFGPSNAAMPNSTTGDASFALAAANTIFGAASTANLVNVMQGFVANWKGFYSSNGVPGLAHATADQIDLAARGAAWGDTVGVALANNIGPLAGQTTNFLQDAAQGTAVYSAALSSQPTHTAFQGEASAVSLAGVSANHDAWTF